MATYAYPRNSHIHNKLEQEDPESLLKVHEVAKILRVDDTTVRRWIHSGALEAISLPHRGTREAFRVKHKTLDALLQPVR